MRTIKCFKRPVLFNKMLFAIAAILFAAAIVSCNKKENVIEVDPHKTEQMKVDHRQSQETAIRIAVGGMITPKEGFGYYKELLDYIEVMLGKEVKFIDMEDYSQINKLIKDRQVDLAFVCGGPYVDGRKDFGMELLAAPYAYGGTVYYSYIVVRKDSLIDNLEGLRGKTFAFTDPLSNTGKLVPEYMLSQMNETPESFFKSFDFTHAHDRSIRAVAEGLADGAAVDSLIWEYADRTNPEYTSKTKIIKKSPPYGIPPVVVRPGLDRELKEKLRHIFLNIHNDEKGRKILKGMMVERFVPVEDSAYDTIREMKKQLSEHNRKKNSTGQIKS